MTQPFDGFIFWVLFWVFLLMIYYPILVTWLIGYGIYLAIKWVMPRPTSRGSP